MPSADSEQTNIKALPETRDSLAIAIQQKDGKSGIPTVIAGGKGRIAEQILAIAFQHGIKVREDADLAELLGAVDIDSEIPVDAFAAVAEILTYVYQINNAMDPNVQGPAQSDAEADPDIESAADLAALWAGSGSNQ